jgi:NitT/TauT family transport system ATP-binding protein
MDALALELRGVRKAFGRNDLLFDAFSFGVPRGQSVAIVGPSGAGKSTLLNLVALVDAADAGEVRIDGTPRALSEVGTLSLAYIFQRDALLPWKTVLDNVMLGLLCRRMESAEWRQKAMNLLSQIGLAEYRDRLPATLSGGQRQLAAIAQNLLLDPNILLLDEPFSGLDFQNKLLLEQRLLRLLNGRKHAPVTCVFVTHDIEEALVVAERVIVLGRKPGGSSRVILDIQVPIPMDERDPVTTRQSPEVRHSFQEIWAAIRPLVSGATNNG